MNLTPREEFLVTAFEDDPRLVEMFRAAERTRKHNFIHALEVVAAWVGMFAVSGILWWGILRAIGAL